MEIIVKGSAMQGNLIVTDKEVILSNYFHKRDYRFAFDGISEISFKEASFWTNGMIKFNGKESVLSVGENTISKLGTMYTFQFFPKQNENAMHAYNFIKEQIERPVKVEVVSSNNDISSQILELKKLLDSGIIDEEEFKKGKEKILSSK